MESPDYKDGTMNKVASILTKMSDVMTSGCHHILCKYLNHVNVVLLYGGITREISIYVCAAYIAICGPDEEQSGFVAFTMRVESGGKCECLSSLQQTSNTESQD